MSPTLTAEQFVEKLNGLGSEDDEYKDVGMGQVFALAKEWMELPPEKPERREGSLTPKVRDSHRTAFGASVGRVGALPQSDMIF